MNVIFSEPSYKHPRLGEVDEERGIIVDSLSMAEFNLENCTIECTIHKYRPNYSVYGVTLNKTFKIYPRKSSLVDNIYYKFPISSEEESRLIKAFDHFEDTMRKLFPNLFNLSIPFVLEIYRRDRSRTLGCYSMSDDNHLICLNINESDDLIDFMSTVFLHEISHYIWETIVKENDKMIFLRDYVTGKNGRSYNEKEIKSSLLLHFKGEYGEVPEEDAKLIVNNVSSILKREFKLSYEDIKILVEEDYDLISPYIPEVSKILISEDTNTPSSYGRKNIKEFFCESVCNYFYNFKSGESSDRYASPISEELKTWFDNFFSSAIN